MALEIFRLVGSVFVDTYDAQKSLQKTDKEAGNLGQTLVRGAQSVGKFALGVAGAAAAAGTAIVALTESTREYRTEQGKLTTAFETQNFSAEAARSTYEELNGILGDSGQAVEAANHLAMLADNEKDLATWTDICTGVYATFGDSLPIEGLTEAANETAKTGSLTGSLADALNWAGVNEDKFQESLDKCANEQERQALITETLNGLYSESAENYRENNGEIIAANKAQDKLNKVMADAGAAFEPVVTWGKELLTGVLEKAIPFITDLGESIIPAVTGAFEGLTSGLEAAATWARENETILTLVGIAVATLTTALIAYNIAQNAATIATTIATTAATIAATATTAWGAAVAFLTSPITLTIAAIGALIAIVYLLVTHWDTVKEAAGKCWDWIKGVWAGVSEWFNTKVTQPVSKFFSGLWEGIKKTFSNVTDWFKNVFSKAWQAVKNVFSAGGKIFDGIKDGIANVFTTVVNAIIRGINKVISIPFNAINNVLKKIRDISILGAKPFSWISTFSVPQIPELEEGAVLKKGQVGLLEGNGAEAVVPLDKNKKWISAVARDMEGAIGGTANTQVLAVLLDILEAIESLAGMGVFLDRRKLVGYIAKDMNKALGQLQVAEGRT